MLFPLFLLYFSRDSSPQETRQSRRTRAGFGDGQLRGSSAAPGAACALPARPSAALLHLCETQPWGQRTRTVASAKNVPRALQALKALQVLKALPDFVAGFRVSAKWENTSVIFFLSFPILSLYFPFLFLSLSPYFFLSRLNITQTTSKASETWTGPQEVTRSCLDGQTPVAEASPAL